MMQRRDGHHFIEHGIHGQSVDAVQCREQDILFLEGGGDLRFEQVRIGQIRGRARPRGPPCLHSRARCRDRWSRSSGPFELVLAGLVQHLVVRHDEVGLRADLEGGSGDVHALPDEGIGVLPRTRRDQGRRRFRSGRFCLRVECPREQDGARLSCRPR